ncbi:MAG: urease accessory protein [Chthoniobacter sp.]|jgi:urease accessory protein|nr:urease accessory protein [Chthoniobacter sp.]
MTGHLSLVCAADDSGQSYLREQSFCAPMHLSKPFTETNTLVVNAVNVTAGLFAGDEVSCHVRVESGARLLLTSPSAQRAHRSPQGTASLRQEFFVGSGAFLEVLPEIFIPHGGASYRQRTTIAAESGAELIFFEMLAPGRVAMGENFAFDRLDWETDVHWSGRPSVRERYSLSPADESLEALRDRPYYASCFAFGEDFGAGAECWCEIARLHDDDAWIGCSAAVEGGGVVKILARDSVSLRRVIACVRAALYGTLRRLPPQVRRV